MVVGAAAAGAAAAGAHTLFGYNRENFLYDRKQRQEAEFKILEWRRTQAELWREDVRDIIGLTERKMDTYLIVNTLQLGMVCGLFSAGRLEPGTPPWLLQFYMLTLGAAFMYLLMSVWLAMHANVVASSSSVRLLTQFVRLPVPTWEEIEQMRTYGESVEGLKLHQLLRVPFISTPHVPASAPVGRGLSIDGAKTPATALSAGAASATASVFSGSSSSSSGRPAADPWGLELHGVHREIHELAEQPIALRRHVKLAGRAARQYQCFDAFARVAMSFGTHQLLNALGYYVLGVVSVQDGAPWPAWCAFMIMAAISLALVHLDFSLTKGESLLAKVLVMAGPACSCAATGAWTLGRGRGGTVLLSLLPAAFASHGLWLFFALNTCGIKLQPNGAWLPEKFRTVLYLDVFGWLQKRTEGLQSLPWARPSSGAYAALPHEQGMPAPAPWQASPLARCDTWQLQQQLEELRRDAALFQSEKVRSVMTEQERARVDRVVQRIFSSDGDMAGAASSSSVRGEGQDNRLVCLKASTDIGTEVPYFLDPESGEVTYGEETAASADGAAASPAEGWGRNWRSLSHVEEDLDTYATNLAERRGGGAVLPKVSPAGEHPIAPENAFHPESYSAASGRHAHEQVVTGHGKEHPGRLPAKIFRLATWVLIALWAAGTAMPLGVFGEFAAEPLTAAIPRESGYGTEKFQEPGHARSTQEADTAAGGLQDFRASIGALAASRAKTAAGERLPSLPMGELVEAVWPRHSGFVPRSMSCDPSGTQLVVADDLGVYVGRISRNVTGQRRPSAAAAPDGPSVRQLFAASVEFDRVPPCAALEGQALQDIGVVCGGGTSPQAACYMVVLHAHGRRLAQCKLGTPAAANGSNGQEQAAKEPEPALSWVIASDWLRSPSRRRGEHVEAIAIESDCLLHPEEDEVMDQLTKGQQAVHGCGVTVGTSSGRIVQLRAASLDRHRLVPERAMQLGRISWDRGSLHVFRNGFVLSLQRDLGVVQAFNARLGTSVGKWLLPAGLRWLSLCGGGDSLFLLGMRNHSHPEVHRFAVPPELQREAQSSFEVAALEASTRLLEM